MKLKAVEKPVPYNQTSFGFRDKSPSYFILVNTAHDSLFFVIVIAKLTFEMVRAKISMP